MKKEYNALNVCHPVANTLVYSGDWSPHRSTVEIKEWTLSPELTEVLAFGDDEASNKHGLVFSPPSTLLTPQFQEGPGLQEKKQRGDGRVRCVSNESLAQVWGPVEEPVEDKVVLVRNVSLEIHMETLSVSSGTLAQEPECRPKRRRNPSISEDAQAISCAMDEDDCATMVQSNKRRRLHDRKRALDNHDFGFILAQL
jgi:hypothetical protein